MATTSGPFSSEISTLTLPFPRRSLAIRAVGTVIDYWHLLSLDAPTVAVLWTSFLAITNHVVLPAGTLVAIGLAVWMIYATDRLLDSRVLRSSAPAEAKRQELEARHYFHRRHRRGFCLGIGAASAALALVLPQIAPPSLRLFSYLGVLLFGYFMLIHTFLPAIRFQAQRLPKELVVGIFFSAAVFIPTIAQAPGLRPALLPIAILFAVTCSLNCLFIYVWEHPLSLRRNGDATRVSLRFLPYMSGVAAIAGLMLTIAIHFILWPIPFACVLSTCLLLLLHHNRQRLAPTTLRAAADLCLLTPALLIPLIHV